MVKQFYISLLIVFLNGISFSQKLNSSSSESVIYVGQPVEITYSLITDADDSIRFEPHTKEIPVKVKEDSSVLSSGEKSFEILGAFRDSTFIQKGRKYWEGRYTVTVWDSGIFILPGPRIIISDSTLQFDDLAIKCMLVDPVKGVDLYDIKEKYADIPPPPFNLISFLKKNWWWIALILVSGIVILILRRKKQEEPIERKMLSLKERTLLAIDSLEESKLWEKGKLKEHFVELSYIIRRYLTSRYGLSLMEKTTEEIKLILAKKGLEEETIKVIVRILSTSDMVKFAKSQPDIMAILKVSNLARQVVAETSPIEFDGDE